MFKYETNVKINSIELSKITILAKCNYNTNEVRYIKFINSKSYSIDRTIPNSVLLLEQELQKLAKLDDVYWRLVDEIE